MGREEVNDDVFFHANEDTIPPEGTPVVLVVREVESQTDDAAGEN